MSHVNVLVVEDFAPFREFACRELQRRPDFRVVAVSDGLAAIEKAQALQPEVILLDIGLPSLNGLAAAHRIRAMSPAATIVFVTQESSPEIVHEALALGARAYIQKTCALHLLATVEAIVDGDRIARSHIAASREPQRAQGEHRVQFYTDEITLLEAAEHFVASALTSNGAALAVATRSHLQLLLQRLTRWGNGVNRAVERGAFAHIDADELVVRIQQEDAGWQPDVMRIIDAAVAATSRPRPRVAVFSECASILWSAGHAGTALSLERQPLEVADAAAVDTLCTYPLLPGQHNDGFQTVCAHHGAIAIR